MEPRDFCYWLQGYFEIHGERGALLPNQVDLIRKHLALVFAHSIDPQAGPAEHQAKLNEIHGPGPGTVYRC